MKRTNEKKQHLAGTIAATASIALALTTAVLPTAFADSTATSTTPIGKTRAATRASNAQSATVLVYMNGSDLESETGMATSDIKEMLSSGIGSNAKVVIETLGTRKWQNYGIASDHTQRYLVDQGKLKLVDDSLGQLDTTSPDTLADFISWGVKNYPADRYILLLWDHGAGPVYGFGYDEFQDEESALTIDEMKQALDANPNVHFDLIGMDCCIMGSLETYKVLAPYCDYSILSEDFEPSIGWHYERWMGMLEENPGVDTVELGKVIVDDMIADVKTDEENGDATLALFDSSKADALYDAWVKFAYANEETLLANNYSQQTEWNLNVRPSGNNGCQECQSCEAPSYAGRDPYGFGNGYGYDNTYDYGNNYDYGSGHDYSGGYGNNYGYGNSYGGGYGYYDDYMGYGNGGWDYWNDWDSDYSYVTMTDYYVTDIMEVAGAVEGNEATDLKKAYEDALVYYAATDGEEGMGGLGVSLPYGDSEFYNQMVQVFTAAGIDEEYVNWLKAFVNAQGANDYYDFGYGLDDSGYGYGYDDFGYGTDDYGYDTYGYNDYGHGYGFGYGPVAQGYNDHFFGTNVYAV